MAKVKKAGDRGKKRHGVKVSNASTNPDRPKESSAGGNNKRSQATIKRLNMYRGGKARYNRKGQKVKDADYQSELPSGTQARVAPNRKWFGNTRVISQHSLQTFQEKIQEVKNNPYQLLIKNHKLPMSLVKAPTTQKSTAQDILQTESYEYTFGKKAQRKKPKLPYGDIEELLQRVVKKNDEYDEEKDTDIVREDIEGTMNPMMANYLGAGKSKRIYQELYKVLDSSDVVIMVLDARDPMGTRCRNVEKYLREEKPHKHLIFILNKSDLVPTRITKQWVAILSKERPTLAFHASINNSFGKGALINLLRQFSKLHSEKKNISCGLIGYPNVGKSAIINTLMKRQTCKSAPLAGETKVWQYVTLMKRINLVDCPGIVQPSGDTETELILKGVVRVEYINQPEEHIAEVLSRVKKEYIMRKYLIESWDDHEDFLEKMAIRTGKLLKKGEANIKACAKKILNDWQRGEIPYYVRPPDMRDGSHNIAQVVEEEQEADETKAPTAAELEKKLEPVQQNLDELKLGFTFKPDQEKAVEESSETNDHSEEKEEETNDDLADVSESSEPKPVLTKEEHLERFFKRSEKNRKQHKLQMQKLNNKHLDDLNKFQQKREETQAKSDEKVRVQAEKRKRKSFNVLDDDESDLTSKQKRKKTRDAKPKKTGSSFYNDNNIKNRKRNKHNPKADRE